MNNEYKYAIIGSRDFGDYELASLFLSSFDIKMIISGGAAGSDEIAEKYAKNKKIPITIYYANWDKYGKGAGFRRNLDIIHCCNAVIAFYNLDSSGTAHSLSTAIQCKKPIYIKYFDFPKKEIKENITTTLNSNCWLSNSWPCDIHLKNKVFSSVERALDFCKSMGIDIDKELLVNLLLKKFSCPYLRRKLELTKNVDIKIKGDKLLTDSINQVIKELKIKE